MGVIVYVVKDFFLFLEIGVIVVQVRIYYLSFIYFIQFMVLFVYCSFNLCFLVFCFLMLVLQFVVGLLYLFGLVWCEKFQYIFVQVLCFWNDFYVLFLLFFRSCWRLLVKYWRSLEVWFGVGIFYFQFVYIGFFLKCGFNYVYFLIIGQI